jgi:phage/plasmid-like protein (TIGR03299 family)
MTILALKDNLDWTVGKRPVFTVDALNQPVQIEDKFAVVRSDTDKVLGIVGANYEFVQNNVLKGLIAPMVEEGILIVENQGTLNHGGKVFIQALINKEYQVLGEDYKGYITLLNGHVGTASVGIGTSNTRVVCGNTYKMASGDLSEKFRHHAGVNEKVLESTAVLTYVDNAMGIYANRVEKLATTRCTSGTFEVALEKIFQKRVDQIKQVDQLNNLFYNGAGNEGRSLYDAFNAVTDLASHKATPGSASRFSYANFGVGSKLAERAMHVLSEMALA